MTAIEISRAEKTLRSKPVFIQGIMQPALHELTAPCDVVINGLALRLPVGCVIEIGGGGTNGAVGSLQTDVVFRGKDGENYKATKGMALQIPLS